MINKIGWPWIGTTEHEMGSMSSSFKETDQSANMYDTFAPDKSAHGENPPSIEYSEGRISPVEGDGEDLKSEDVQAEIFSKDSNIDDVFLSKANESIEVLINKKTYLCNIANNINDKIAGLQRYDSLTEKQGLLFTYSYPQDVMYHMGSVSFPIDIIFVDENNRIKKISKNIAPGSIGTFGASDVKYVLEVLGGQCDKNNIDIGSLLKFSDKKISKFASKKYAKKYVVYNFDSFIEKNSNVNLFKIENLDEDNIYLDINNQVFSPGEKITAAVYNIDGLLNKYAIRASEKSLGGFLNNSQELYKYYKNIKLNLNNADTEIIFVTKFANYNTVLNVTKARLENLYGTLPKKQIKFAKISHNFNHLNIIDEIHKNSPTSMVTVISSEDFTKNAGREISNTIKNKAKELLPILNEIEELGLDSLDKIQHNMNEYQKIANDQNAIINSQGQFHQSIKRNAKIVKKYLLLIKKVIQVLDEIKDATTTMAIIESLAGSARSCSQAIQEIFNLSNSLKETNIINLMKEKTQNYESSIEDLESTIDRTKKYINENILGLLILSY